ncbi:MAG: glycosyltransferase [Candidatus Aenigmatarchaeota archaeon]|nr:hypothetical protein [Candidatus Aenigmarchaeota archaeon]
MKILIFTAITGHTSLAQAAKSFLKEIPGARIKIINIIEDRFAWGFYKASYRFLPFMTKIPYEIIKNGNFSEIIRNYFLMKYRKKILNILKKEKPDIVISTYFGYNPVLDEIRPISKFKFINVVSDPVTIHPLLFAKEADYNFGFNHYVVSVGKQNGVNKNKIVQTGWLVRKEFLEEHDVEKIRKRYGIEDNFTLLFCGGSEGNNAIIMLLPSLFLSKHKDLQIIFICGNNKGLEKIIKQTYAMFKAINTNIPNIIVRGFTKNMDDFIAVSDVVVGKAGPNLLFESVSMKKPFIAISHISGQEDGNLELIRKYNLGWVAEEPAKAANLIKTIVEKRWILKKKKSSLEKVASMNLQAGKKLVDIVSKSLNVKT